MKIILDANILMAVAQFKVDIFSQLSGNDLYTIEPVIDELNGLSKGNSKDANSAKIAVALVRAKGLKILKSKERADNALLDFSQKGFVIATQDKALRKRVKDANGKAIYIRQKKYVIL